MGHLWLIYVWPIYGPCPIQAACWPYVGFPIYGPYMVAYMAHIWPTCGSYIYIYILPIHEAYVGTPRFEL